MKRGQLRVLLGAAPGVGKTASMLVEGHRLQAQGRDVVIGLVDAHGRSEVEALAADLEKVAPGITSPGGELDVGGIVARRPEVVLVDELAHNNTPGSRHEKRWKDVIDLLEAGIDVITTLNVHHLESLNDVVREITGVAPAETIPDQVVRGADQIEIIDLAPEGIRERLSAGRIYPADQVDAAVANYFRPGNLAALRELALSWTADRVDEALSRYRQSQGIEEPWETKERVMVAISGAAGGEDVIRRAARMAMRYRAELIGVHVRSPRGSDSELEHLLAAQRSLLNELGGRYHEVVGEDVGRSLLSFARAENATQIVLGASRRSTLHEWWRASPIRRVLRHAGQIDVHVVSYEASRHRRSRHRAANTWSSRRRGWAWLIMAVGLPALNWLLLSLPGQLRLENVLLIYLLGAVVVGLVGGALPAAIAAVLGFLLANFFFTPPLRTWTISDADDLLTLVAFLLVATLVGTLVGLSTRRAVAADRARAQAEALAATASLAHPVLGANAGWTLARIRDAFSLDAAAILRQGELGWTPLVTVGSPQIENPDDGNEVIPISADAALVLRGGSLTAEDRRVLAAFVAQMVQALEWERLEREAATAEAMAETNRMRTALLNAVSHDLRTPLATIKASVTSLLETGVAWSPGQVASFHHTILGESERLNRLVGNLLDASRLQAGAVHVFFNDVGLDEVVAAAVASFGRVDQRLEIDVPETLPAVQTDAALLERVVANLIENALAVSEGTVRVAAGEVAGRIDLRIADRGPGIPPLQRELVFEPFHRLSGTGHRHGVGLGLTVSRGFLEAMGNELTIEDTPGGGTTMVIALKPARPEVPAPSGVVSYE